MNGIQKFIVLLCLALLAGRLLALGLEVGTRPVTGWDAKQHWARQARVFFEFGTVMPYVPAKEWLAASGDGVYTSLHHNYPVVVPLLQAWVATAFGEWHESIVGLPWLLIWCAIGLVFYSQARLAGVTTEVALAATYMVLSMPLLNIHVALAGYADSMLAATYLAAVAALHNWSRSGGAWQLLLAVTAGAGCMLIKHEGFYWMLTLLPGFILVWLGEGKGLRVLGGLFLLLPLAFLITPEEATIAGHSIAGSDLGYRPESWDPLLRSSLIHDNWHLLIYLYIAALILAPWRARANLPLAAVLLCASGLYLALFLFSRNATGAAVFTSLNRVELQLAPAIAFFTLSVAWALKRPARSEPAPAGGTAHPGNTG